MKRILLSISIIALAGFSLSACNTIEGLGEDIEASGQKIKEVSR